MRVQIRKVGGMEEAREGIQGEASGQSASCQAEAASEVLGRPAIR